MIYPIVAYGDPVLRKETRDIVQGEVDVKKLAEDMFETMYSASGVGLAAPQIGLNIRMFVVDGTPINEAAETDEDIDQSLIGFKKVFINAEILEGHLSSGLCHTGNISLRLGSKQAPGAILEKVKAHKEAADSYERMAEHLKKNGVDIEKEQLTLGEFLTMDTKTEKFIGNAAADKMLTREYRAPYIVPEKA